MSYRRKYKEEVNNCTKIYPKYTIDIGCEIESKIKNMSKIMKESQGNIKKK